MKLLRFLLPEDSSPLKRLMFYLLCIAVFLITTSTLEKWYWRYWPFEPAVIHSITVTNPNKEVCAGDDMTYLVEVTKTLDVPCTVKRTLINSQMLFYAPIQPPRKPLGYQHVSASIHVPRGADYREYYMGFTIDYEIGPEKRIVSVSKNSEKFRVIQCDK